MEYSYVVVCVGILCVLPSCVELQHYNCDWPDVECGTSCCNVNQLCRETSRGPTCTQTCVGGGFGCPDNGICCTGRCCKSNQDCRMGSCQDMFVPSGDKDDGNSFDNSFDTNPSGDSSSDLHLNQMYGYIGAAVGGSVLLSICIIVLRLWCRARLIRRLAEDERRDGVTGIIGVLTVTRTVERVPEPDPAAVAGQRGTVPEPPPYSQVERSPTYSDYRVDSDQKKLVDV